MLQVLLQARRLQIAQGLPYAEVLTREMEQFRVKINIATGHDSYEAWRERDHDDLVLSLALACWYAENGHSDAVQPCSQVYSYGVKQPTRPF